MNRKYSPEMRERALRMHVETRPSHPTMRSAVRRVAGLLGMSPVEPGVTSDGAAEIKRLQKVAEGERDRQGCEHLSRGSSTTPRRDDPVHHRDPGRSLGRVDQV